MASRTTHVKTSIVFYIAAIVTIVFFGYNYNIRRDTLWLVLGFLMILFGSEAPDLDQLFRSFFNHRDWFTHSAILPTILSVTAILTSDFTHPDNINGVLLPILGFFNLGVASHLFMDWLPSWNNPDEDGKLQISDISYAMKWSFQGLTGEELVQKLVGTYLIHLPFRTKEGRKTLTKNKTRAYLMINALILIAVTVWVFYVFADLYGTPPF